MSDADSDIDELFMGESDGDNDSESFISDESASDSDPFPAGSDDSDDGASFLSVGDLDLDPENFVAETQFENKEDAKDFRGRGLSKHSYNSVRLPLERGDARFFDYYFHSKLGDSGKARLGTFVAGAENLVQFHVKFDELQPTGVGLLFRGPFEQTYALRRLKICANDDIFSEIRLHLDDWRCISGYLRKCRSLRHLDLCQLSLGRGELDLLASALEGAKLVTLSLSQLVTRDEDDSLEILLNSLNMNTTKLETIDIIGCSAGSSTCDALANILRNKESKLEILNLDGNNIDNDCIRVLCAGLAENSSLKALHLNDYADDEITDEGWALLEKLVFDKSSLEQIYRSNHTLEIVAGHPRRESFRVNQQQKSCNKGHAKIISFLMDTTPLKFNIEPFVELNVKMMPYILEFFGNPSPTIAGGIKSRAHTNLDNDVFTPLLCLHEIVHRWNMPHLFSFPSAESVRLSTQMNEIETQNHDLRREMELLRLENSRLQSEINLLKSSENQLSDERKKESKKRSRLD